MKTNFGTGLAATAAIALFAAMALLPAAQAAAPGDISRTFYRQEPGFAELKSPGLGFFGNTNHGSVCIIAFGAGQILPPAEEFFYYEQARIYTNVKEGFANIPGPVSVPVFGGAGPLPNCPAPLVVGALDPTGYSLVFGGANVAVTLDHIFLSALIGTQQPVTEIDTATSAEWDVGVCPYTAASFTAQAINDPKGQFSSITGSLPAPLNTITGSTHIACSAWTAVREADSHLTSFTTGNLQTDEVQPADGNGPYYFVSCLDNNISWINVVPPVVTTGTRTASSHDWALVVGANDAPAAIAAAVQKHLVGAAPVGTLLQGLYDLSGDNGNPCDAAGAPADTPLLAKK